MPGVRCCGAALLNPVCGGSAMRDTYHMGCRCLVAAFGAKACLLSTPTLPQDMRLVLALGLHCLLRGLPATYR